MAAALKKFEMAWQAGLYPYTRKWIPLILGGLCRRIYRLRVEGLENLPESGAYILAGNHQSLLDLFIVHPYIPRNVNWLAKQELFSIPLIGEIVRRFGAIPVDRENTDVRSVKVVFSVLRAGGIVGVFPEATRLKPEQRGKIMPRKQVVELLIRSSVPIVPFAIAGPIRLFHRNKLVIGKPFRFPGHVTGKRMSDEEAAEQGQLLMHKIYRLISVPVETNCLSAAARVRLK